MGIKVTVPNTGSDYVTFGSANTADAAKIGGYEDSTGNGHLELYTTASGTSAERMRIDSSGNVGIGTSSPVSGLEVVKPYSVDTDGAASKWTARFRDTTSMAAGVGGSLLLQGEKGTGVGNFAGIAGRKENATSGNEQGYLAFYTTPSTGVITERMRIDSSGNLLVGTTGLQANFTTKLVLSYDSGTTKWAVGPWSGTPTGFIITGNGANGVYLSSASATAWSAVSDESTKTDLVPIEDAANKVNTLRAVIGRYVTDEEDVRRPFLIAQDVQNVLPEAVNAAPNGKLGISYTETIPLLVAAIKELKAELDATKAQLTDVSNEVAALKGASV